MSKIRVALAGVGNLASALVQGLYYYKDKKKQKRLKYPSIGGYRITDIEIVAAFDVDVDKVGKDLSEAIFAPVNKMEKVIDVPHMGIEVLPAPVHDGISGIIAEHVKVTDESPVDVVEVLKKSGAEMLVNLLPTGAVEATRFYANAALDANVAFINGTSNPVVNDHQLAQKFSRKMIPLIGDDLQSHGGGTTIHKILLEGLYANGVYLEDTYQLDVTGGLEGLNTLDNERRTFKKEIKEKSIKRVRKGRKNYKQICDFD